MNFKEKKKILNIVYIIIIKKLEIENYNMKY